MHTSTAADAPSHDARIFRRARYAPDERLSPPHLLLPLSYLPLTRDPI